MNNDLFQQARAAYARKDFQGALAAYTQCLQDAGSSLAPGEVGLLYHQIGNCLVKLKNPNEAIHAYTQATADAAYDACGAVNYNLGMAYASLHDYEDAVKHFEIAVSDAKYDASYKAYSGMGNALLKLGKSAEAGVAFREAALDEANPDPTKALLNLGVCFMALDRPADAVASYESALQFDMQPDTRNKLYANLGQAYVASGQMQKAVNAFDESIADKTYFLSDSASVDYQRAIAAVAQGTSEITQVMAPVAPVADMSGDSTWPPTARPCTWIRIRTRRRPGTVLLRRSVRPGRDEPLRRPGRGGSFLQRQRRRAGAVVEGSRQAGSQAPQRGSQDPRHHHPDRAGRFRRRRVPVHAGLGLSVAGPGGRAAVLGSESGLRQRGDRGERRVHDRAPLDGGQPCDRRHGQVHERFHRVT